jgi:hypothetical protein
MDAHEHISTLVEAVSCQNSKFSGDSLQKNHEKDNAFPLKIKWNVDIATKQVGTECA